jgi:hypothetical protein
VVSNKKLLHAIGKAFANSIKERFVKDIPIILKIINTTMTIEKKKTLYKKI